VSAVTAETTVLVVRHGETDWNRDDRLQGWAPVSLNERGREQTRAAGAHLATAYEIDRVVSSDLRRARETTALIRDAGVEPAPSFESAWRERDLGVYQGLTREGLYDRHPEFGAGSGVHSLRARPEGGESFLDLWERVLAAFEQLRADAAGETVLVVTHGGPIRLLLGEATGQDLLTAVVERSPDNGGVTELRTGSSVRIVRKNDGPADYP
jgi:probable phosphoglycerate mutase